VAAVPPSTLVGRDRELGILRARLTAARAGNGSLVLIGGEAGIGKTALAEAVCREATERGALVLVGRCYDLTETPPYGPWVELFGHYRQDNGMPPPPEAFARRGTVGAVASQVALSRQVLDFFPALAEQGPLVLLLDDLHWADGASLDLLRFLARGLTSLPLLLVVTYRNEELDRRHPLVEIIPLLVRESAVERLDLRPLDGAATHALVDARYHLSDDDSMRLAAYLIERTEGNALFITELLRTLEEEGLLHREGERWHVGEIAQAPLPRLLKQIIDTRLTRLGDDADALLAVAAVIGQEVPLAVWSAVTRVDEERLLTLVDRAETANLVAAWADGEGIRFTHALIRDVLYESVPTLRRRRTHRQVGEVLAAFPTPDPDAVAYHFQQSGDERAAVWLIRAGERARQAYAWLTAADRFEAALALMERSGAAPGERGWLLLRLALTRRFEHGAQALIHLDRAAPLAAEAGDDALAAQVRFYRGNIRCVTGDIGGGMADLEAGTAAVAARGPADGDWHTGLDLVDADWARSNLMTWFCHVGRLAEAEQMVEGLMASARERVARGADPRGYGLTIASVPHLHAILGRVDDARQAFATVFAAYRDADHHLMVGIMVLNELIWDMLPYRADDVQERRRLAAEAEGAWARASGARTAVPARFARTPVLFIEGEWDEARALALAAYTGSGEYAIGKMFALTTLGPLAHAQGDATLVRALARDWLPDGPDTPPGTTFYAANILQRAAAATAIDAGEMRAAREWLAAHDRWLEWSGAVLGQSERHLDWARYHRAAGDAGPARVEAERARERAMHPRQPLALLAVHRQLGELDTDAGRFVDAAQHLDASLALADACQAPFERALTLLALAELHAATDGRAAAIALLDEARTICIPLDAAPTLARADALAARLASMSPPAPVYPDGLSAREVDVLRLIACGSTNQEIAATLSLSVRTVERHITSLYRKIDGRGRADATTYALRNALVLACPPVPLPSP